MAFFIDHNNEKHTIIKNKSKNRTGIINMLFVLSLEWQRFSISEQVVVANRFMSDLTDQLGVSKKVIFNCASMGAGERLLPFAQEKNVMPEDDSLDYIRWHHAKVLETLRADNTFMANRDFLEMLLTLRSHGHQLAAVLPSKTSALESLLEEAHARDFFEDAVYGYDRRNDDVSGNLTLAALYATAIKLADANYEDSLVVADNPTAIQDALPIHPKAVVGYLDPYIEWDVQSQRLKEMQMAGAHYTAVGGHTVTNLPWYISGRAEHQAKQTLEKIMGRNFH
jgi:beta-phosphoglucomutase-like phosphatase (HAD superfamily)